MDCSVLKQFNNAFKISAVTGHVLGFQTCRTLTLSYPGVSYSMSL